MFVSSNHMPDCEITEEKKYHLFVYGKLKVFYKLNP